MQDAITITLPVTGAVVTIKGFLTTGQSRELQRILLSKGAIDAQAGKVENISPDMVLEMQDKAAELLIQEVKNTDGTTSVFSKEWLFNLPMQDGNVVYEQVNQIVGSTTALSDEAKKK